MLSLSIFKFDILAEDPLILPSYKGSTLRGGFGKAIDYLPYFIYTFEELGRIGIGKGRGSGDPSTWDFKGIIEKAKEVKVKKSALRWYDWERYSFR